MAVTRPITSEDRNDLAAASGRFWSNVDDKPVDDCWRWRGCVLASGYGQFWVNSRRRHVAAHRAAWVMTAGRDIPAGLQLDHLCRVRECVNPAHLEPVDARTNTLRGESIPAHNARKTHCGRGHELTEENLRPDILLRGGRTCLICSRAEGRALNTAVSAAHKSLGITYRQYRRTFGTRMSVARAVLSASRMAWAS